MQRFARFRANPRNRAGLATALIAVSLFLLKEIIREHYVVAAVDAIPCFAVAFLLGRALKVPSNHARSDEIGMLSYLPLLVVSVTFLLVPSLFADAGKQAPHALDSYYTAAAAVLAALLIALMIESRGLLQLDPQLQALRSWWIGSVVVGLIAALVGLTPDLSPVMREAAFQLTWAGFAGAITAGCLVMGRDWLEQLAARTRYTPRPADDEVSREVSTLSSTSRKR
jgi:hypothetical protein